MGYQIAQAMVLKSRNLGKCADYQQLKTIQKLRSCYSNLYMTSPVGLASLKNVGGGIKQSITSTTAPPTLFGLKGCKGLFEQDGTNL
jgi:hypothetical protein